MKFIDRIFAPKFQPVFPIIFREQDRTICSRCLCFYQGAYGCMHCKREILESDYSLEERFAGNVDYACPHCRTPLQDDFVHVASYCRNCQGLSNSYWLPVQDMRVIAMLSERDFELFTEVACMLPSVTINEQLRYLMLASRWGTEFVIWAKSAPSETVISTIPHLLSYTSYLWIDAEGQDPLHLIRKIDAFVREWLIDDAKIKQVRAAVWQSSLDPIIANWLAAHFDEVYYNVLPETVLNLPVGGTPLSVLMKKRGF